MEQNEAAPVPAPRKAGLSLGGRAPALHWGALLCLSALFVLGLEAVRLPAALLIGPMAAGVAVAISGGDARMPRGAFFLAQGLIGCMIGRSVPPSILTEIAKDWPLLLGAVISVVIASNALGWALARWGGLPGATAVWGSSPGAASAMTIMSASYGADIRLVAFMQYTRVVMVVIAASLVTRIWTTPAGQTVAGVVWFPAVDWPAFAATVAIAFVGAGLGRLLRIPAGSLLVPFALSVALQGAGAVAIELPEWLLATAYAVVGWSIGLRFTRPIFLHAARRLPRIAASILALIAICGGFAAALVFFAGVDPLTAYLATSPGGADSVAIIAASSHVDAPFVMALQTARLVVVIITGPPIARFISRRTTSTP
ncbi:MAG TPA: AbrB family transcriptional regulator [Hansschlegelia sp.]